MSEPLAPDEDVVFREFTVWMENLIRYLLNYMQGF
jgi:hypothetical protein